MGPRSLDRGEGCELWQMNFSRPMLQWGRGLWTAERTPSDWLPSCVGLLQWGRGLWTAESDRGVRGQRNDPRFNGAAVFGPRRGCRCSQPCRCGWCFNGAAVFGPRRVEWPEPTVRGNYGFNGAAVFGPRRGEDIPANILEEIGFNGAAVFGPRRGPKPMWPESWCHAASMGPRSLDRGEPDGQKRPQKNLEASMGPRSLDRGEGLAHHRERRWHRRFNGAAVFGPRRAGEPPLPRLRPCCFNGAAVFGPRRGSSWSMFWPTIEMLQWGRGLWTAER